MNRLPVEILLAEDSDDDILLTQEAFAGGKLINTLKVVRDGEEAMAYLRQDGEYKDVQLPGIVLLDINMPRKNGLEVLEEIKADPELRHIPVIMLTTSEREQDIAASYSHGACSFIKKPVRFDEFREVLEHFQVYWSLVARLPGSGT